MSPIKSWPATFHQSHDRATLSSKMLLAEERLAGANNADSHQSALRDLKVTRWKLRARLIGRPLSVGADLLLGTGKEGRVGTGHPCSTGLIGYALATALAPPALLIGGPHQVIDMPDMLERAGVLSPLHALSAAVKIGIEGLGAGAAVLSGIARKGPTFDAAYKNDTTLYLEPISDVPLEQLFVSRDRWAFDVDELARATVESRSFINPYTQMLFSAADIRRLKKHHAHLFSHLTPTPTNSSAKIVGVAIDLTVQLGGDFTPNSMYAQRAIGHFLQTTRDCSENDRQLLDKLLVSETVAKVLRGECVHAGARTLKRSLLNAYATGDIQMSRYQRLKLKGGTFLNSVGTHAHEQYHVWGRQD